MADILDSIFKRRSVRVYERKPVEKEKLVDLLKAAMAAPSASNSRPWEFVVITDEEVLKLQRRDREFADRRCEYGAWYLLDRLISQGRCDRFPPQDAWHSRGSGSTRLDLRRLSRRREKTAHTI